jgi:hypothetical protein
VKRCSLPDFDPDMQLYAFQEDKMIGVVTSSLYEEDRLTKANLVIPFVVEGYEDARDLLLNQMITALKSKGATSIRVMVSEYWGETTAVAERNGFIFDRDIVIQAQKRFDEIDESNLVEAKDVQPFAYQKHADAVTRFLMTHYKVTEEDARLVVDRVKDWETGATKNRSGVPQRLVSYGIVIKSNEVVGRQIGFQQDLTGEKTVDLTINARDDREKILHQLLSAGIKESIKSGMEILHIGLREPSEELRAFFSSYGLEFRSAAAYYIKDDNN